MSQDDMIARLEAEEKRREMEKLREEAEEAAREAANKTWVKGLLKK